MVIVFSVAQLWVWLRSYEISRGCGNVKHDMQSGFIFLGIGIFLLTVGGFFFRFPHRIQQFDIKWLERAFRDAKWFGDYPDLVKGPAYRFFMKYGGFMCLVMGIVFFVQGISLLVGYDMILGVKITVR